MFNSNLDIFFNVYEIHLLQQKGKSEAETRYRLMVRRMKLNRRFIARCQLLLRQLCISISLTHPPSLFLEHQAFLWCTSSINGKVEITLLLKFYFAFKIWLNLMKKMRFNHPLVFNCKLFFRHFWWRFRNLFMAVVARYRFSWKIV